MRDQLRNDLLDYRIINFVGFDENSVDENGNPQPKIYFLHAPESTKGDYIEYEIYDDNAELFAENEPQYITYYIQIDIFSPGDYSKIEEVVKAVMKEKGYEYAYHCPDLFEEKTQLYHKPLRYTFTRPA